MTSLPIRHARTADDGAGVPTGFDALHAELQERIRDSRQRAARHVNAEMVRLYWQAGRAMLEQKQAHGWSSRETERVAAAVRQELQPLEQLTGDLTGQLDIERPASSTRVAQVIEDLEAVHASFDGTPEDLLSSSLCVTGFRAYHVRVGELLVALADRY